MNPMRWNLESVKRMRNSGGPGKLRNFAPYRGLQVISMPKQPICCLMVVTHSHVGTLTIHPPIYNIFIMHCFQTFFLCSCNRFQWSC